MKIKRQTVGDGAKRIASRRRDGMTLVEVVVALAVTGLAVAGIINGYNYCTYSAQKAALSLAASARAMERIEEVRSAMWDPVQYPVVDQLAIANFPTKVVSLDLTGAGVAVTPATLRTEISQVSTNPPLKRVRVDCVWDFRGNPITNTIETFRAPIQ